MGRSSPAVVVVVAAMAMLVVAAAPSGGIDFGEEDLASEEALWALYERWSAEYKVQRDVGEKLRRFDIFKQRARFVHDFNKLGNASFTLGLNMFGDMTTEEIHEMSSNPYLSQFQEDQQEARAKALRYFMVLYCTLACFAFLFILFTCVSALVCRAEKREAVRV
jgi:KDEL-tailed cysteine endopeptidase